MSSIRAARQRPGRPRLHDDRAGAVGQRVLRPRARRVHRRGGDAGRRVRAGRRRHAIPRRGRRAAAAAAGGAAARHPGGHLQAGRRQRLAPHRVPAGLRDQPGPAGGDRSAGSSAATSTTASPAGSFACPRCASGARTSCRWRGISCAMFRPDVPDLDSSPRSATSCSARTYPGNVRDLRQLVARIASRHVGPGPDHGRRHSRRRASGRGAPTATGWRNADFDRRSAMRVATGAGLKEISQAAAETAMRIAVDNENGNLQRAARRLGVTDRALQTAARGPAQARRRRRCTDTRSDRRATDRE